MRPGVKQGRATVRDNRWIIPGDGVVDPDPPGDEFTRWPHPLPFYRREWTTPQINTYCALTQSVVPFSLYGRLHGVWNPPNPEEGCGYFEFPSGVGNRINFPSLLAVQAERYRAPPSDPQTETCRAITYDMSTPTWGANVEQPPFSASIRTSYRLLDYPLQMGLVVNIFTQIPLGVIAGFPQWPKHIVVTIGGADLCDGTPNRSIISGFANGSYVCRFAAGTSSNPGYVPFWRSGLNRRLFHWTYWVRPSPHAPGNPSSSLVVEATWRGENGATGPNSEWSVFVTVTGSMVDGGTSVLWGCNGPAERRAYLQGSHTLGSHNYVPSVCAGSATLTPVY